MDGKMFEKWFAGIGYEVAFWKNVYRWRHTREGMFRWSHYSSVINLECFDANAFLNTIPDKNGHPLVLDVGCGLSYATGNLIERDNQDKTEINLHYIDPLAQPFNNILKRGKLSLPPIEFGMVEYLSGFYPNHDVDLVIIQNALDHSSNPVKGIYEAIDVLRHGGILYLNHHPDEAVTEHYKGFHQWNINDDDGQLIIWNKHEKHYINKLIGSFTDIEVKRHESGHVIAVIKKRNDVPQHLLDEKADKSLLCQQLMDTALQVSNPWTAIRLKVSYWRYNAIQFLAQAMPWKVKMALKKIIKQA